MIVRVWTSGENKEYPGNNVGHVSIETTGKYMSLWPMPFTEKERAEYRAANCLEKKYLEYFIERQSDFKQSYEEDCKAEKGKEPQVTLCFYSLETYMMEKEFYKLTKDTKNWRLIGSNLFVQTLESITAEIASNLKLFETKKDIPSENCASLALKILKAGALERLVNLSTYSSFSSNTSSVVAPDDILTLIIPAKRTELNKYPETQEFKFPGELSIPEKNKKWCSIF